MANAEVQCFLSRARGFLKGMELLKDDLAEYRNSSALLGIHAAISYGDALRVGMGNTKLSSDDHQSAVSDLKSMLAARKYEKPQGADRLGRLVSQKSKIVYSADSPTEFAIKQIVDQAQRFAYWAEETGKKLPIEGW
jgi:hypothetical protein